MVALLQSIFGFSHRVEKREVSRPAVSESGYKVGEFCADYSVPTHEEIAAEDPEVTELYNRSKLVSR